MPEKTSKSQKPVSEFVLSPTHKVDTICHTGTESFKHWCIFSNASGFKEADYCICDILYSYIFLNYTIQLN